MHKLMQEHIVLFNASKSVQNNNNNGIKPTKMFKIGLLTFFYLSACSAAAPITSDVSHFN